MSIHTKSCVSAFDTIVSDLRDGGNIALVSASCALTRAANTTVAELETHIGINIREYFNRVVWMCESPSSFILSLVILDALVESGMLSLTAANVHRTFMAAITIAIKFIEDKHFKNSHYAIIGGMQLSELNSLEKEILVLLGYNIDVVDGGLEKYCSLLLAHYDVCYECKCALDLEMS
jgi:hypothetical protein